MVRRLTELNEEIRRQQRKAVHRKRELVLLRDRNAVLEGRVNQDTSHIRNLKDVRNTLCIEAIYFHKCLALAWFSESCWSQSASAKEGGRLPLRITSTRGSPGGQHGTGRSVFHGRRVL